MTTKTPETIPSPEFLQTLLRERFGLSSFREGQREAIEELLVWRRLLCIQPTGYGKSLLYQLPASLFEGITLVISPLLALMRDQLDHLRSRFHIPAAAINTDQTEEENEKARSAAAAGKIKILFIAPEQLDHIDRFQFLLGLSVDFLVVDEAHCISTWGHDFRPSYRQILSLSQALAKTRPNLRVLGLTATANGEVERDIVRQLSLPTCAVRVRRASMNRPNLCLSVIRAEKIGKKLEACKQLIAQRSGPGIVYSATRENSELVAEYLQGQAIPIVAYHAGLEPEKKKKLQQGFASGEHRLISATTALGMGIDKGDLRFIIHFDIPGSITAYYQEIGRAGRDGKRAEAILLYCKGDLQIQEYFINSALPSEQDFQAVLEAVRTAKPSPRLTQIKCTTGLHPTRVTLVIAELVEQGFLVKKSVERSQVYQIGKTTGTPDLSRYSTQHQVKTKELARMVAFAEAPQGCRMAILREALGDTAPNACGQCDLCLKKQPHIVEGFDAQAWLEKRPVPIAGTRNPSMADGLSLFDGKLASSLFVRFMKERAKEEMPHQEILSLLLEQSKRLDKTFGAVIPLPSRTWKARDRFALELAHHWRIPCLLDLLQWKTRPEKRQGELLNNDQRRNNVHGAMEIRPGAVWPQEGALLLLDDYIGSGATLKEAARALSTRMDRCIVPLTVAAVKWRLGSPGFVM